MDLAIVVIAVFGDSVIFFTEYKFSGFWVRQEIKDHTIDLLIRIGRNVQIEPVHISGRVNQPINILRSTKKLTATSSCWISKDLHRLIAVFPLDFREDIIELFSRITRNRFFFG